MNELIRKKRILPFSDRARVLDKPARDLPTSRPQHRRVDGRGRTRSSWFWDTSERADYEWVRERIFVIVNHRYREALPTVFTSNIGPKDLAEQLGERTASRIIAIVRLDRPRGDD